MEREAKRTKFECQEPRDPQTKMGKVTSPRSSSFSATTSSYNGSVLESTSPVLDTAKVRLKGKPWKTRRAVSDSAFSIELEKLKKDQKMQDVCNVSGEDKNLQSFLKTKNPVRCPDCNSTINDNQGCRNCSEEKLSSRKSGCPKGSLVDRFRDLKRHKKPLPRSSDLKDARIPDEAFVESVKMLDRACNLTPPTKALQRPKKQLGLVPFVLLERISSLDEKKQGKSVAVTHLSLDEEEDKEDDMFADTKDSADASEDLNEFSQLKYKPADTSAKSFHGFSPEECSHSREVARRSSQFCEPDDVDEEEETARLRGFPPADIATNENLLQNWKSLLENNYPNSQDWEDWFVEESNTEKENNAKRQKKDEKNAREDTSCCGSRIETIGNARLSVDCEKQAAVLELSCAGTSANLRKRTRTPETTIKAEVPSPTEMKYVQAMSTGSSKSGDLSNLRGKCGVTTAGGCPIGVSETAIVKAESNLSQNNEIVEEDLFDEQLDNAGDSRSKCGFSTAGGHPISVSKTALAKAETLLSQEEEKIKSELPDEKLDNTVNLRSKCEFSTAGGRPISVSKTALAKAEALLSQEEEKMEIDLFADELDNVPDSRSKCGFSTASGRPISISKTALAKAEALLSQEEEKIKSELPDEKSNNAVNLRSKCGFSTAGGRPLSVSKTALAKAEILLSQEEEKIKSELPDEKLDDTVNLRSKCEFSTAGGRPISVSKTALAKAEALLSQEEEKMEIDLFVDELDNVPDSRSKCGFSTASGRPISISKTALAKAEALLSQEEEKIKSELPDEKSNNALNLRNKCGFSTAGVRPLSVSKTALLKAKARLSQENGKVENELSGDKLDDSLATITASGSHTVCGSASRISEAETRLSKDIPVTINDSRNHCETNVSSSSSPMLVGLQGPCGFSTARGRPISVSETAINKAKRLHSEIDDCGMEKIDERPSVKKKTEEMLKKDCKINVGFATAGGRELKVSEESWLKSKALYDAIEEPRVAEVAKTDADPISLDSKITTSKNKPETMPSGFSTANGRSITVSSEAVSAAETLYSSLDNMESLDFEDFVDPVDELEVMNKRKFEEIDDDTPLRRDLSLKRKRGRYVNDLQARKLFNDDEDEVETRKRTSRSAESNRVRPEKNLISEEVDASAAALLEDEQRSNEGTAWQINAQRTDGSASPELGCETGNKSRADVSIRNLLNRAELKKVNVVGSDSRHVNCARAVSNLPAVIEERNQSATSAGKSKESQEIQYDSIPDDLTFDSQFSQDIQCSPVLDIAETMKIMEGRFLAASKQDETITAKRRMKPESCDGFLYQLRTANRDARITWKQLTDGIAPGPREISDDSLRRDLLAVTANSAAHYSFRCADFYGENNVRRNIEGIKVGDGAFLILDGINCAGAREFERAFLASPGVDPNLVPMGWVRNHYRWIVWKLASMDRIKFGHKCLPRMLTPDRVMLELKYRYDREIYRTQWPPLRRILERGEDAARRIVLCVSSITEEAVEKIPVEGANTPNARGSMYRMIVTDGWYSITTSIDAAMTNFIRSGKVKEGTKLMIFGAKAVNLDQGCPALEIPEDVTLRIYSNSVRRARWNMKLDYYRPNPGPMNLSLKSVKPNGGAICKLVVAVARVYPILYREKLPDGQHVFRNERCDEEAARAHAARYQSKMEEIYAWSEFQIGSVSKKRRSYTPEEAAAWSQDMENELRQKISLKMSECLPKPRDVTPVMKIRIAEDNTCALVTVWDPTERDTTELFAEGSSIAIYNAFASGLRSNELQITAGRSTFVKRQVSRRISYPERIYTPLSAVTEAGFNPVYGEFDTIGIVSSSGPAPHGMKNFETVNLACPMPSDATKSDFLSVLFWQGVSAHGYEKILTVGSLVACSNLEWRRNNLRSIPTAYCTDRSVFSKSPRQNHLAHAFESLRNEIKEPLAYAAACAAIIEEETAKKSALRTPGGTPYKPAASSSRTPGWSPRDLTSSIDANSTTPGIIDSRKASSRKRLEKLEIYGEAPKLPSIVINNSSSRVSSDFRSPVLTPVTKS